MKEIPLTKGLVTLVDDDVFEWASEFKWFAHKSGRTFYAGRQAPSVNGKQKEIKLHREILQAPEGLGVDHVDHNGLNNLRENLRLCSMRQNQGNQQLSRKNTTGFKGVSRQGRGYQAALGVKGRPQYLGYFATAEEAALAYNAAALRQFGEFACLNILP